MHERTLCSSVLERQHTMRTHATRSNDLLHLTLLREGLALRLRQRDKIGTRVFCLASFPGVPNVRKELTSLENTKLRNHPLVVAAASLLIEEVDNLFHECAALIGEFLLKHCGASVR